MSPLLAKTAGSSSPRPFRSAMLRGLGVMMPPLLTIVLILWALNTLDAYIIQPIENVSRYVIVTAIRDVRELHEFPRDEIQVDLAADGKPQALTFRERQYVPIGEQWLPAEVFEAVKRNPGESIPATADAYYSRYVAIRWLQRTTVFPFLLSLFILLLYFLGKYMAAGAGRMLVGYAEALINRLPLVSNVYSSVKQVTDFLVTERSVEYNRVVAVEFPRRGTWSIGFVTGEGMLDLRAAANEPVLTVLLPTSPMPATGFTVTIRKSEAIDLNITIDQAIQFIVSCGVVIPPEQLQACVDASQRADAARQDASPADNKSTVVSDGQPTTAPAQPAPLDSTAAVAPGAPISGAPISGVPISDSPVSGRL